MKRCGESLVELAISIALIMIMLLWLMPLYQMQSMGSVNGNKLQTVTSLAGSRVEYLKTRTLDQLNSDVTAGSTSIRKNFIPENGFQYAYIRDANETTTAGLTLATITVVLYEGTSGPEVVRLCSTYLRDSGGSNAGN